MNTPNLLTATRVMLVPVLVVLMAFDHLACYALAFVVFLLAALTDYYDGKIARDRDLITNFGKLFDPVADKVLIVGTYVMLMDVSDLRIPAWTVVVIIAREFLVTGARLVAACDGAVIAADRWGKTKTIVQMLYVFAFLILIIVSRLMSRWFPDTGALFARFVAVGSFWAVVFVALVTVQSGVQFARLNWQNLKPGNLS